jgi:serine/threonine protein kinase
LSKVTEYLDFIGVEVDDCMMVIDDDILFFSKEEEFIPPESIATESPEKGRNEGERLPSSVGGYKVGDLLGRGGFGEVRCGDHQLTGERVALKFLRKAEIHSLGAAERTNTEIQCLATLKHHNIIKLIQVSFS